MDDLMHLDLLEALENAENNINNRNGARRNERNPLEELSDSEFRRLFRLNKDLFNRLLDMCEPFMRARLRPTDISIPVRILTALRFFATGSYQLDIGSNGFLDHSQPSVSRALTEVVDILNRPEIVNEWVKFPSTLDQLNEHRTRFFELYQFPGIIGVIDCTHVAIFPPQENDPNYPENIYVNRKGYHSINVQLICDSDLKIINVNARFPGSCHDTHIWNNSNCRDALVNLHQRGYDEYFLLGDSGYPQRTYLMTPITPEPQPRTADSRYNIRHKSIRSTIERCNGVLKTRFRCLLKHRVLHYKPQQACKIIMACVILHNMCIAANLPEPLLENEEDIDFGMMDDIQNIDDDRMQHRNPEVARGIAARNRLIRNL